MFCFPLMMRKNRHGSNSIKSPIKSHDDPCVLPPVESLRSRGTMHDALRSRGFAPLDKNMPPIPRPDFPETDLFARTENVSLRRALGLHALPAPSHPLDTTCEQGSATGGAGQRHSWPRATPTSLGAPDDKDIRSPPPLGHIPLYTPPYRGVQREGRAKPRSGVWKLIELPPAAHAGSDSHAPTPQHPKPEARSPKPWTGAGTGAVDQFHRLTVQDMERRLEVLTEELKGLHAAEEAKAASRLEKDKRELIVLFASGRDAGFIVDVSESSPAPVRVISW